MRGYNRRGPPGHMPPGHGPPPNMPLVVPPPREMAPPPNIWGQAPVPVQAPVMVSGMAPNRDYRDR